jgi:hypothetical protein
MAAKQPQGKRRPSTSGVSRSYSEMYKSAAAGAAPASAPATATTKAVTVRPVDTVPAVLKTSDQVDWKGEYGYVLSDLRTLGIVTAALVIGIIVVGMFL